MNEKEKRRKVTGLLTVDFELTAQPLNSHGAWYFASQIELDKWCEMDSDSQITNVARSYLLKIIKGRQQVSLSSCE